MSGKHYFRFWNGLLSAEHRTAIGPALWEFLWCIDATTEEVDGVGVVLGGTEVKLTRIVEQLGVCEKTVRSNLKRLAERGYITATRGRYGVKILVQNSKKWNQSVRQDTTELKGGSVRQDVTVLDVPVRQKTTAQNGNILPNTRKKTTGLLYNDDNTVDNTDRQNNRSNGTSGVSTCEGAQLGNVAPVVVKGSPRAWKLQTAIINETGRPLPASEGVARRIDKLLDESGASAEQVLEIITDAIEHIRSNPRWDYILGTSKAQGVIRGALQKAKETEDKDRCPACGEIGFGRNHPKSWKNWQGGQLGYECPKCGHRLASGLKFPRDGEWPKAKWEKSDGRTSKKSQGIFGATC